ncbi:hypothetical protein BD413DRAFT_30765 [Trametes elegans]|nr:hypothetical protein BD413DRAFT_30765 [Trametes elegans]
MSIYTPMDILHRLSIASGDRVVRTLMSFDLRQLQLSSSYRGCWKFQQRPSGRPRGWHEDRNVGANSSLPSPTVWTPPFARRRTVSQRHANISRCWLGTSEPPRTSPPKPNPPKRGQLRARARSCGLPRSRSHPLRRLLRTSAVARACFALHRPSTAAYPAPRMLGRRTRSPADR